MHLIGDIVVGFFNFYIRLKDALPNFRILRLSIRKIMLAGITCAKLSIYIIYNNLGSTCIISSFKQFQSICIILLSWFENTGQLLNIARVFLERCNQMWWFYWPTTRTLGVELTLQLFSVICLLGFQKLKQFQRNIARIFLERCNQMLWGCSSLEDSLSKH